MGGIIMGSSWDHFGIIFGSFWDHFKINLGSFWDNFGNILGSFWDHFGIILGSFLEQFGIILGSFFGTHFEHPSAISRFDPFYELRTVQQYGHMAIWLCPCPCPCTFGLRQHSSKKAFEHAKRKPDMQAKHGKRKKTKKTRLRTSTQKNNKKHYIANFY